METQGELDVKLIPFEIHTWNGIRNGAKWLRKNKGYKYTSALRLLEKAYPDIKKQKETQ